MSNAKFSIIHRIKSFKHAINGLHILIKEEHNARVHLLAALVVCVLGCIFKITALEWIAILLSIGLVISFEIVNTCIEKIADYISPEWNDKIKIIKDLSAAAVLVSALISFVIGLIIFVPSIIHLLLNGQLF